MSYDYSNENAVNDQAFLNNGNNGIRRGRNAQSPHDKEIEDLISWLVVEVILEIVIFSIRMAKTNDCSQYLDFMTVFLVLLLVIILFRSYGIYYMKKHAFASSLPIWSYITESVYDIGFSGFLIYGNYLFYSDSICPDSNTAGYKSYSAIEIAMYGAIIYGYIVMLKALVILLILLVLLPLICCGIIGRQNAGWVPIRKNLFKDLTKTKYDPDVFKTSGECPICLANFNREDEIIALPCDPRHFFHAQCIIDWLENNAVCPLCKAPVTEESIKTGRKYSDMVEFMKGISEDEESNKTTDLDQNIELNYREKNDEIV